MKDNGAKLISDSQTAWFLRCCLVLIVLKIIIASSKVRGSLQISADVVGFILPIPECTGASMHPGMSIFAMQTECTLGCAFWDDVTPQSVQHHGTSSNMRDAQQVLRVCSLTEIRDGFLVYLGFMELPASGRKAKGK